MMNLTFLPNKYAWLRVLVWLVMLGFAMNLRWTNINFGLPQRLHPDEWSQVEIAWQMANGDWNPHFFRYPAGHQTLLAILYRLWSFFYRPELSDLYLAARWVSAIFGTLGVALVSLWAARLWDNRWATLAAGLLATFSWTWIEQSHYAVVDIPLMFWSGLTLFALSNSPNQSGWQKLTAVALGLAMASKYTATLLLVPLFLVFWLENPPKDALSQTSRRCILEILTVASLLCLCLFAGLYTQQDKILSWSASLTSDNRVEKEYIRLYAQITALTGFSSLFLFALNGAMRRWANWNGWARIFNPQPYVLSLLALGVFALLSPFTFIEWRQSAQSFFYEYRHMQIGSAAHYVEGSFLFTQLQNASSASSFAAYASLLTAELGYPVFALATLGFAALTQKRSGLSFALFAYLGVSIFVIGGWRNYANRYALPLYFPLIALASGGIAVAQRWIARRQPRWASLGAVSLIGFALWIPAQFTFFALTEFQLPDTRQVAYAWIRENIPDGACIAYDNYAPDFRAIPAAPYQFLEASSYVLLERSVKDLRATGVNFVITSFDPQDPVAAATIDKTIWVEFTQNYQLIKVFQAQPNQMRGRSIWVYQEKQSK